MLDEYIQEELKSEEEKVYGKVYIFRYTNNHVALEHQVRFKDGKFHVYNWLDYDDDKIKKELS